MNLFIQKFFCVAFMLAFLLSASACDAASGFQGYKGGLLKMDGSNKVRIYQPGSRTNYRDIHVTHMNITITDARWQGENSLAVYLTDSRGVSMIYLYSSFTNYRIVK